MKKALFIDRDGTLIHEPEDNFQIDSLEKLCFMPGLFNGLKRISDIQRYELIMVSNQDGLGTDSFPFSDFEPAQNKLLEALKNEGICFDEILIDNSFEYENSNNRKPNTGMLKRYMYADYDLENSFVIGDRISDMHLAQNLGTKFIGFGPTKFENHPRFNNWKDLADFLLKLPRLVTISRKTQETDISVSLCLDGTGQTNIYSGIPFLDHLIAQIARHGNIDIDLRATGDLEVDDHHTIEDVAIVLGQAFKKALGSKIGIARYGFLLPMDDCLAQVAIDFGGRNWLIWDVNFSRENIGGISSEMFFHFFKSFSDEAKCNLNIKAEGENNHHKIEAVFKAVGKSINKAIKTNTNNLRTPSTKEMI